MIPFKTHEGFTLIELVMVIMIIAIIAAMSSKLFVQGATGLLTAQNTLSANWQGQIAMERMTRDIRDVRSAVDVNTMTSG